MIGNISPQVYCKRYKNSAYLYLKVVNHAYPKSKPGFEKNVNLGIRISPEQFGGGGEEDTWILGNDELTIEKNKRIRKVITDLEEIYWKLKNLNDKEPPAAEIVDVYKNGFKEKTRTGLIPFITTYIESNELAKATADVYKALITILAGSDNSTGFLKQKYNANDIYLDEIDTVFMYRFELYIAKAKSRHGKTYEKSTAQEYVNKLKALVAYAKKIGEIKTDPLADYEATAILKGKKVPNLVTSMSEAVFWRLKPEDLHKIETIAPEGHGVRGDTETATGNQFNYDLQRIRLLFLTQTWTGFSFADLAVMKNVKNFIMKDLTNKESIIYNRQKNGELAMVPLFDQTRNLLEALDYNVTPLSSYDTFLRKIRALMTYYAIELTDNEEAGAHLGRHLFGSRMLSMGFSMESVSRMMGHTSIRQTEKVYARIDITKIHADYEKIKLSSQLGNQIAI